MLQYSENIFESVNITKIRSALIQA